MKKIMLTLVLLISFPVLAQQQVTTTVSLSSIFDLIKQEKAKGAVDPAFEKRLEGSWYNTYFQPQVYPGGCQMDSRNRMQNDKRVIKLSLFEPLEVAARLERVAGKLRWSGSYAVSYEGNTLVTEEGLCVITYQAAINGDVLTCYRPYNKSYGNCGYYSFFVRL